MKMASEANSSAPVPTLRHRKLVISANLLLQIIAALALVVMVNWLASRHYWRLDWTKSGYYQLSEKTKQVLSTLPQPVKVVVFLQPAGERDPEFVEKIYQDARNLLKEFQFFGKNKLPVEYVDPQRDLARAKQLVEEYKVDQANVIIFASGDRHKYVAATDMVEVEQQGMMGGGARIKSFKAEGVFLSAIQSVIEGTSPNVYFLTGHGEHDPEDFDERRGYSALSSYIKRDNITVKKWNSQEKQSLPTDAGALVIAGPHTTFTDAELGALEQYLKNHGRLLVMLDPRQQTGLESFMQRWGVQVDDDLIVSPLLGMINVTALGTDYATHPITARMEDVNTSFPYARSVRRAERAQGPAADQPRVTELVKTPSSFWGETNPDAKQLEFDPATDLPGPLPVAVAIELGKPKDVKVDIGVTRAVVVGCSSFVDNHGITGGNVDFFMNAMNWLLQREQLVAVGPKTPEEFRLSMSLAQVRTVYALVIGGLPLAVAAIGMIVWTRRRR
jgi:ABC-type uncharacterized transport system involved in gliding motility auxiliary subunit